DPMKLAIRASRRPTKRAVGEEVTSDYDPLECSSCWRQAPPSQAALCCRRPTRVCSPSAKTTFEPRSTTIRSAPAGCWRSSGSRSRPRPRSVELPPRCSRSPRSRVRSLSATSFSAPACTRIRAARSSSWPACWPARSAKEVMVPRTRVVGVPIDATPQQAIDLLAEEGHTRMPVFDGDLDHIKGVLHAKDVIPLLAHPELIVLQDIVRPALFVPWTK